MSIVRVPEFEFFYLPVISITTFFFYYFEIINNMSWIVVIIHIRESSIDLVQLPNDTEYARQYSLSRLWYKEVILICIFMIFVVPVFVILTVILILSFTGNCAGLQVYYPNTESKYYVGKHPECNTINDINKVMANLIFGVGVFAALSKVLIGFIMLWFMKKRLNKPYLDVKKSVWITMAVTCFVIGFNAVLNYTEHDSFSIFWVLIIVPIRGLDPWDVWRKFLLSFINVLFELFLMTFTADNIDFRGYLYALLLKRGKLTLLHKASHFLVFRNPKEKVLNYRSNSQMPTEADFNDTLLSTAQEDIRRESSLNEGYTYFDDEEEDEIESESDRVSRTYTELFDQITATEEMTISVPLDNRKTLNDYKDKINSSTNIRQ